MIGCIIQARMCSTRLKGKVLHKINPEETILSFLIKQIANCKSLKTVVVATTNLKEDDVIVDFLKSYNVEIFRGNSENVLDRFYHCAKKFKFSTIVRLTADNPLIDPFVIDSVIENFLSLKCDYSSNTHPRTFPQGNDVEIFSFKILKKTWENATKFSEKEHVTPYMYNNLNLFKRQNFFNAVDYSNLRYTVDYLNDFKLVQHIANKIKCRPILFQDVVSLLEKEPKLLLLNKDHVVDQAYKKSNLYDKN
tara:strand:+ start:1415 stop:2164 length:750 start_codon:yes stop_codon:yes gene_type:complete